MTARRVVHALNPAGWLTVIAVLAAWQALVAGGVLDYEYLPDPSEIVSALGDEISSGAVFTAAGHTIGVALLASAIALVIGGAIGVAVGLVPKVRVYSMASFDVLRTVPVVALMPVTLLIWGTGARSEVIVAVYAGLWPILVNTAGGVRAVHPRLREVARTFRLTRWETLKKIVLPAATPTIVVGGRLSIINALVVAIVAEMLISSEGLGWALVQSQQALQPATMWAYAMVCGMIGFAFNVLLVRGTRLALPGVRGLGGEAGA